MRKIIIVDDEFIAREMLRDALRWEEYGYSIVGEAGNGREALKKVRELAPDVVITDIRMPGMDGLELIRRIREKQADVKVVLISSYEEFSYVQHALQEGAVDYLTKHTFQPEDIIRTLKKLDELFDRERRQELGESALLRQRYSNLLFSGDAPPGGKPRRNPRYDWAYAVCAVSAGSEGWSARLAARLGELSAPFCQTILLAPSERILFCLYRMQIAQGASVRQLGQWLARVCKQASGASRFIGMSQLFTEESDIYAARIQAMEVLRYSLCLAPSDYADYSRAAQLIAADNKPRLTLDTARIRILMKTDDGAERARELIIETFRQNNARCPDNESVLSNYQECLLRVLSLCRADQGDGVREIYERLRTDTSDSSLETLEENLIKLYRAVRDDSAYAARYSPYIASAMKYIDENITSRLSLDEVAGGIGISRIYLSQLFRKELKTTFVRYTLARRIELSQWLLINTNNKIYEISRQAGFNDVSHFSVKFKEVVGMSPLDYRRGGGSARLTPGNKEDI